MTGRDEEQGRWPYFEEARSIARDILERRSEEPLIHAKVLIKHMLRALDADAVRLNYLEARLAKAEQERDEAVEERDRWFQQYMELALDSGDLEALKGKAALADEMAKAIHWAGRATGGVPLGMRGWLNTYEALSTEPSASREDQG